jgi:hypothetical protein
MWFLEVLLLFSVVYAVVRTVLPRRTTAPSPMRARYLLAAGLFVAVLSTPSGSAHRSARR